MRASRARSSDVQSTDTDGGEGSLPDGRSPSPGEPGEENPNDETEGAPYPTSPDQLRAWVREAPKPDSREEFASQHMALGVWALWKGREPPEKKPGPAYDIGAELRKLRRRHGAATNRELALFIAGVCLRRDEGEYGGVDPGEGMTLGFVDALNSDRSGRSEWSLAKQRARQLLEGEDEDAVDRVLADLEPV